MPEYRSSKNGLYSSHRSSAQLNPKLGKPYFPMQTTKPQTTPKPQPHPSITFSQLLQNPTRPNSVCNLISTQPEDSYKKKFGRLTKKKNQSKKMSLFIFDTKLKYFFLSNRQPQPPLTQNLKKHRLPPPPQK